MQSIGEYTTIHETNHIFPTQFPHMCSDGKSKNVAGSAQKKFNNIS